MTFAQPQSNTQHTHARPFASRSRNSLLSRAPSSTTLAANAFITGVDGKDLWLSPPNEGYISNSASAAPYDAPASSFSLLAPAETPGLDADYASSQLFPSIDSWISAHLTNTPGKQQQQQSQPSLSLPLPTHSSSSQSPPLWSPSSASTSSSEAAAAAAPATAAPASSTAPPLRQTAQRRQSSNNRQPALSQASTSLANTLQHPAIPVASTSASVSPPLLPSRPRRRSSSRIRNLGGSTGPISLALPVMNDNAQTSSASFSSAPTAPHPASDASNITQPALVSTASGGQFRVSARHAMKEACSYDLRQHQEPPTVDIEYPNTGKNAADSQDVKEIKGLERTLEKTPGPVCFPRTSTTPAPPGSPSRVANSQDVKANVGSSSVLYNNKPTSGSKASGSNAFLQQVHMQNQSPRLQQQASPRTAGNPQLGAAHDIQVPAGNLPQMPAPQQQQQQQPQHQQQQQQGGFNAHPQPPPNPAQRQFDHTDAQLLAALGGQGKMQQGSPQQPQRTHQGQMPGSPARGQAAHQQLQNALSPQQQAAQRQQNFQGYGMLPPQQQGAPGSNNGGGGSTDIQVPQANPMQNAGTPSQGQSSLPPLPNYQSAPAPLNFADGSFFSHQAILASLQAEENAKAAAAAAAVMGFQNGNWAPPSNGSAGQQQGQQGGAPNGQQQQQQFNSFQAQPGQQPVPGQQQLPGFSQPGTSNALGDFSFEQHFGAPQTAGNSPDAATASSRKRGKGKRGQNYGGAFNFGGFGNNNGNNNIPVSGGGDLDADGEEDEDDSKPQFNSRGVAKRKSASTARELAQAQQQDHVEEYEYQGFVPKGSGGGANAMPPSANAGPGGGGGYNEDSDSEDDEGDEWVAEESDDSYGKKKRPNKRARKSSGKGLTQAEADALRSASPTTAAAALASVNADGNFDFASLADFAASPDVSGASAGGKKRKNNAAPPGSGQIVCNHVDPKTGEVCLVRFRRPYDQARHMETVHSDQAEKTKWACITCKKSFSRKDALIRHGRISNHATM